MKDKIYLLKNNHQEYTLYDGHIILDGTWCKEHNEIIELTEEDFSILLDALWGQTKGIEKDCRKLAKKIAKFLNKKHKRYVASNCKGAYWDVDKLVEELGVDGAMNFIEAIENDRKWNKRMRGNLDEKIKWKD